MPPTYGDVLWKHVTLPVLHTALYDCLAHIPSGTMLRVFFRADDIGVPSQAVARLLAMFRKHQAPLALAVVPAWLTRPRWRYLQHLATGDPTRWCWHQHGWRHINHEKKGKKQEFGPARQAAALAADLMHGRQRLESLMGSRFTPIFTPPWNRCSRKTLEMLKARGYLAVSRDAGAAAACPAELPDIAVNVDLHTRRENDAKSALKGLAADLFHAFANGTCGIMIHHQRMNPAAFEFLDLLVKTLATQPRVRLVGMRDLVDHS